MLIYFLAIVKSLDFTRIGFFDLFIIIIIIITTTTTTIYVFPVPNTKELYPYICSKFTVCIGVELPISIGCNVVCSSPDKSEN